MVRAMREGGSDGAPSARTLGVLAALGGAHAAWAAFEWVELVVARRGGEAVCGPGGGACGALWDGAFASAVQGWTGLPVAAWGFLWSLLAAGLPLWALRRRGRGEGVEPAWSAALWTAAAGVLAVVALASVSAAAGALCPTCAVTYLLVLAYAGAAALGARGAWPARPLRGAAAALLAAGAGFALLLAPGLATPRAPGSAHAAVLAAAEGGGGGGAAGVAAEGPAREASSAEASLEALRERLAGLPAEARQRVADARAAWLAAEPARLDAPRALVGSRFAPVRITEWSDYLCPHCAELHEGLEQLRELLPPRRLAIESRQFPLDAACNPHVRQSGRPLRCRIAHAMICAEGEPGAFALSGRLFERQRELDRALLHELAEPVIPSSALERCIAAESTAAKLRSDLEAAMATGIRGTPHVVLNGRPAPSDVDFLFAVAYAAGDPTHPFFEDLPAPEDSELSASELEARAEALAGETGGRAAP